MTESKALDLLACYSKEMSEAEGYREKARIQLKYAKELASDGDLADVSGCYTRKDMIAAYDAGVWNPNDQKAEEWLNQAYNCR